MNIKKLTIRGLFSRGDEETSMQSLDTFYGVFLPSVLSMLGMVVFLRFGWVIGSLGLIPTMGVVGLTGLIVFTTTLSIISAATNMEVKGGGTYYMVSRSLGIEIGGAIGVPLFLAQALTISLSAMGFAESIHPFFSSIPINYLGAAMLLLMMGFVNYSASFALKSQLFVLVIIGIALLSMFFGSCPPIDDVENLSSYVTAPFWLGFAIFFPAATAIEPGLALSGSLASPKKSLPLGILTSLLAGFAIYFLIPVVIWDRIPRSLLISDPLILQHSALFGPLVIAGIWATTLSGMVGGLLGAPRTLQALATDNVLPRFFAKEWGKSKDPRLATAFCFLIAMCGVLFGSIDKIAPILTMFYLLSYTTINLATGLEALLSNPSWRPTFKIHWTMPIFGVCLCLLAMFMISAGTTFISLFFVITVYLLMRKRNLVKRWEDIWEGFLVFLSRFAIYRLADRQLTSRSWRPNFLVFCDSPTQVSPLINMTSAISKGKGFLTLASIFSPKIVDSSRAERWKKMISSYLKGNRIEALVEFCMDESLLSGAKKMLTNYGIGSLSPNTVVLGEMKNHEENQEYLGVMQAVFQAKKNLIIVGHDRIVQSPIRKIHIWWDDLSKSNSQLMVVLGHMLSTSKLYRRCSVHLNCIVATEAARAQRIEYFNDFFAKGRLAFTPHIYVQNAEDSNWDMMTKTSSDADLVFIGMTPPEEGKNLETLTDYYYKTINHASRIPNAVFVTCLESLATSEILN